MKKIKVAVIGTGGISNIHITSYRDNPDAEVYALCDINEDRVKAQGEKYGIDRLFTDYHEMLKLPEIDAVSVCTWNSEHAACTIAALNAGKHVLCEKPMATTLKDAEAMKEAAERNGKLLMIGFVRRFGDDCDILMDFAKKDFFGEIYYAKASYLRRHGNPGGWFGDKTRAGGGPLFDLGVHVIDLARYIMGNHKPVSVFGTTYRKLFDREGIEDKKAYVSASATDNDICDVEDFATALIKFDNCATMAIETSFSLNTAEDTSSIELFGTKGGAKMTPEIKLVSDINSRLVNIGFKSNTAFDFGGAFHKEINHFIDCIINGTQCRNTPQDGVDLMNILTGIYRSAETGHEVIL